MPWVAVGKIAKVLGVSPEKAGWLMRRLGLKRRRIKGRSQWLIELELLPEELKPKLLPLLKSIIHQGEATTHKLLPSRSQNSATPRGGSNTVTQTATSKELLKAIYDYLRRNYSVIEKERLKDVLQDILKRLLNKLMPKGYKPVEIEKALVRVIKSYRDLGFMGLLVIGDEP
ncbi:MAG: hypothetical protein DRN15_11490 [Thermoprotei archaeon]|nr:MAG: hypothetical protein DRN15_11490 [Thermoprotei archaeon]